MITVVEFGSSYSKLIIKQLWRIHWQIQARTEIRWCCNKAASMTLPRTTSATKVCRLYLYWRSQKCAIQHTNFGALSKESLRRQHPLSCHCLIDYIYWSVQKSFCSSLIYFFELKRYIKEQRSSKTRYFW